MPRRHPVGTASRIAAAIVCAAVAVVAACSKRAERPSYQTFETPEDAVHALNDAVAAGSVDRVVAIFGSDGRELVDQSDPATARRNQQVYSAAVKEGWRLVDAGPRKELVIGNEHWPFPVPLVRDAGHWRFDTAAGKEEVLARRIGRNELMAIQACAVYVAAQRRYAREPHDGRPAGRYASTFKSSPGRHNGLYWPPEPDRPRSPLGDLLSGAAEAHAASSARAPAPFFGYYFRILTAQGNAAPGGAKDYMVHGELSDGFALVAWPAFHDRTGIMTFIVNQSGIVHEKDLGPTTDTVARAMTNYNPDDSWSAVP